MAQPPDTCENSREFSDSSRMKHFYVMWFGQLLSVVASAITTFALGLWVLKQTNKVTDFALIIVITMLPGLVLSPFIGVLIDRHKRKTIMILADVVAAITTLAVAWLYWQGDLQVWHIYLVTAIDSVALAFQMPASLAGLSMLVPVNKLAKAAGMNQIPDSLAKIGAPFLAATLMLWIDIWGILIIDLLTFLFAAITMLFVRIPEPVKDAAKAMKKNSVWSEVKQGWDYLYQRKPLLYLLGYFAVINPLGGMLMVSVIPMTSHFASQTELGLMISLGSIGLLVGSLYMTVVGGPRNTMNGVVWAGLIYVFSIGVVGSTPSLWVVGSALFVMNFTLPVMAACYQVVWQRKVDSAIQGRVFATCRMIAQVSTPFGALIAGPLVDRFIQPMLNSGSENAAFWGALVGGTQGRGLGLLLLVCAFLLVIFGLWALTFKPLVDIERLLPDTK